MLSFADLVRGYEQEGDKEALLQLRGLVERFYIAREGVHPLVKLAIEQERDRRLTMVDEALGRLEQ
ncbi:hypothetical protein IVB12_15800 [Bradyrhizobium sp. 179]|uniref:hypothetical protein n=1 Tax=Bradyrhizobium sp. 179 TaxID=2782648 RepID=UPI001FF7E6E8|nr:hypothetical protein [Bradyrhizobium sp. 179]MCK1543380.1 hypothetical protein [Bradyrhizobium sp. 179]